MAASTNRKGAIEVVFLDRATLPGTVTIPHLAIPHQWREFPATKPEQVIQRCGNADAVITNKVVLDRELLSRLPKLRYIGVAATGVNVVDLDACRKRGITVTNVSHYSTDSVAEHTLMLMLMLARQMVPYQRSLAVGAWQASEQFCYFNGPIKSLSGRKLGLVGTGAIAQRVAELAEGFGMEVAFFSPSGRASTNKIKCVDLPRLLGSSDIVSLHCPQSPLTENLFGEAELRQMQAHAWLLNCARGPIVQEQALLDALTQGTIAGAALDVLRHEPPAPDDPLFKASLELTNLIITPHVAWASDRAINQLVEQIITKLQAFFSGEEVANLAL